MTQTISIHAPAGGATSQAHLSQSTGMIFQFTPLREGRPELRLSDRKAKYFNSRPCGRGDLTTTTKLQPNSIHFNSRPCGRGDAVSHGRRCACCTHFNSRPCGRGDQWRRISLPTRPIFQFTPLREGRLRVNAKRQRRDDFNSRPCGRGDNDLL